MRSPPVDPPRSSKIASQIAVAKPVFRATEAAETAQATQATKATKATAAAANAAVAGARAAAPPAAPAAERAAGIRPRDVVARHNGARTKPRPQGVERRS